MTTVSQPLETISSFLGALWLGRGPTLLTSASLAPTALNGPKLASLNRMVPFLELAIQALQFQTTAIASLEAMMKKTTNLKTFGLSL